MSDRKKKKGATKEKREKKKEGMVRVRSLLHLKKNKEEGKKKSDYDTCSIL